MAFRKIYDVEVKVNGLLVALVKCSADNEALAERRVASHLHIKTITPKSEVPVISMID